MMKNNWILGLGVLALAGGCAAGAHEDSAAVSAAPSLGMESSAKASTASYQERGRAVRSSAPAADAASAGRSEGASVLQQRSVIRRADIGIRVDDVEKAEKSVRQIVEGYGGYVDSASSSDLASAKPVLTVTLRVPAQAFDSALEKMETLGVRLRKSVNSEDVTGQIVDLDARMKTLQAQEVTYRNILKQTTTLSNVLEVQRVLTDVRQQIESLAAQRKTLAGLAALSTITLSLEQNAVAHAAPEDPNWLAQAWGEATTTMGTILRKVTVIGIWALVFSPAWIIAAVLATRMLRNVRPAPSSIHE